MRQMYSCPTCNSPVRYGAEFCIVCGSQLMWQQPPPLSVRPVTHSIPRRSMRAAEQYQLEEFYDEQEDSDFEYQEDFGFQEEKSHSSWRPAVISLLAVFIVMALALGALQSTIWSKPGTNPVVAAITTALKPPAAASPASPKATSSNATQPGTKSPYSKQPIGTSKPILP